MAILQECPACHRKQAVKNKRCACGWNLDRAKNSRRVRYWLSYRLPSGKQKRESVDAFKDLNGYSIEDARKAESKRVVQKAENRILDVKVEAKMTFQELADWYLGLEKVKALAYYDTLRYRLKKFNANFGNVRLCDIKRVDLENHQAKRKAGGHADSTVDEEIGAARTVVNRAFDNELVSGETLKVFKGTKKLIKRNSNARDRILTRKELEALKKQCSPHVRAVVVTGYYTGMRLREILGLTWDKVDLKNGFIRLEVSDTKDKEPRLIPITNEVCQEFMTMPNRIAATDEDQHVFQYNGKPIYSIKKALHNACDKANIPYGRFTLGGFIFHDLRHTFNTNMRKAGVNDSVIMKMTGHSTREMFDRYNTVDKDDAKQAVGQLQNYLRSVDQTVDQGAISKKSGEISI